MKSICQCCKGNGGYWTKLRQSKSTPYKFAENHGLPIDAYVSCQMPGCENGTMNHEENRRIMLGL